MKSKLLLPVLAVLMLALVQCNPDYSKMAALKFHPNDPFKNTIVPSETFDIDPTQDNVVEGENGTVIVLPKGCFKNGAGETVTGDVRIELAEALTMDNMLLSNLTTTSNGQPLETDGMIYFNASAGGEPLTIDKANPIYIEIPTEDRKAGMQVYRGERDENGNMNWVEPQKLETFLVTVDMDLLDFLPQGFEGAVGAGLPYKSHKTTSDALVDSLYYSLSVGKVGNLQELELSPTEYNEPHHNKNKQVVDGQYTIRSYVVGDEVFSVAEAEMDAAEKEAVMEEDGISPATIQVIRSKDYQNTFIATREFEARLRVMFDACRNDILELYINNLDKNLWELDSMAAGMLGADEYKAEFWDFYQQRLTKVQEANKYAELLKGHYEKRLAKVEKQLAKAQQKVEKELKKENVKFEKVATEYKEVLRDREKYRMETYGFEWAENGWINIDNGTLPKTWGPEPLEIQVADGKKYDRVHTYVIYTSILSLYRLNSNDQELFYVGNEQDKEMNMPKKKPAVAIAIAYRGDDPFLGTTEFETGTDQQLSIELQPSTAAGVKKAIKQFEKYKQENRIDKDLKYMALFAKEKKRQRGLQEERAFINKLRKVAFACSTEPPDGEKLFLANCASCHKPDKKLVGPALKGARDRVPPGDWIYRWVKNSTQMIKSGDEYALKIFDEYNMTVQTPQALTNEEIDAVMDYADSYNTGP